MTRKRSGEKPTVARLLSYCGATFCRNYSRTSCKALSETQKTSSTRP